MLFQCVVSMLVAMVLAAVVTFVSTGHLDDAQRDRALVTAVYAPLLIAPPILAYTTRQSLRIHRLMKRLDAAAHVDDLTGLLNRRAFMRDASALMSSTRAPDRHLCIALIDIDHFKRVNDSFGHETGDATLQHVAQTMSASLPQSTLLARLGGEEFTIMSDGDSAEELTLMCERLREAVATRLFRHGDVVIATTISLGVTIVEPGDTVSKALSRADEALYRAKTAGRNCVQLAAA